MTALILKENGLNYNEEEFINLLDTQKNRSKAAHVNSNEEWVSVLDSNETEFIGYDNLRANIRILKYRKSITKNGDTVFQLVFDSTPFYPQGGGQVGDKGQLILDKNQIIEIQNTVKENDTIIHECKKLPNDLNSSYEVIVDKDKRFDSSCNHTSTHLLHEALRKILGDHVQQKGSMVSEKYLRFDFSHYEKLTSQQVTSIQNLVNEKIDEQLSLEENREANYEDCIKNGVIALFGEKYGDVVRSVKFFPSSLFFFFPPF